MALEILKSEGSVFIDKDIIEVIYDFQQTVLKVEDSAKGSKNTYDNETAGFKDNKKKKC